ncbi:hypothetical protein C8Q79DRAFT_671695 [Trametes meyenii]|nr:hypothetical protein C8Q79DRAFT_671695 [Trametes meyenii]
MSDTSSSMRQPAESRDYGKLVNKVAQKWNHRFSKSINPLADADAFQDTASLQPLEDGQYMTATPNTPSSVYFPESCPTPTASPSAGAQERTPKTSLSGQSDSTAVAMPEVSPGKTEVKDIERSGGQRRAQCEAHVPLPVQKRAQWAYIGLMVTLAILLEVLRWYSNKHDGLTYIVWFHPTGFKSPWLTVLLTIISTLLATPAIMMDTEVRKLQPLINLLGRDPAHADRTLLLNCGQQNVFLTFARSLFWENLYVMATTACVIVTFAFQPLAGTLISVQDIWWIGSHVSVNSLAKIGLARVEDFLDMTEFQAASSFASADVMYNVSSPPFISNGYTVAEFELPDSGVNDTVYANRSAVLSQASCAVPDSLAMVRVESSPTLWHNTVLFGQCSYTWTVDSNATYLYGVAPAAFTDCRQDFASVPLQYRPVFFWFFTYKPDPIAALVLCTPHASGQPVSVALDLATGATAVTPLQNSPSDADTANVGAFAYNGVFFDETILDQTALARLQAIQQQLPGAVFEAARTRNPTLLREFSARGFRDLAQDVYSTYLSLVAKIVYFVEDDETIAVRVGSECKRFFVVGTVAHLLAAAFTVIAACTFGLAYGLRRTLPVLPIPPRLGTLGAAIWLTAQTDIALSLGDDAVDARHFAERLSGHRYFLDRESGRIMSVPSVEKGKERRVSLPARVREELGMVWQKATAIVSGREGAASMAKTLP